MTPDQVTRWNAALLQRQSTRTFIPEPLGSSETRDLTHLEPERLGPAHVRHVLVEGPEAAAAIFRGAVGTYGKVVGAPALLVFIGQTQDPGFMAGVGYLGEQVLLEATALGLATCWVGGFFRREEARKYVDLDAGEEIVCVSPVGQPEVTRGLRRMHDLSMKLFSSHRGQRKPLAEILQGEAAEPWLAEALEAARWAPSSYNKQPWRFTAGNGPVTITHDAPAQLSGAWSEDPRTLDCGIAMANFAVAARARGKAGHWEYVPGSSPAKWFWNEAIRMQP